jgi:O-methyltransferase domain/Dimerisation domain
MRNERSSRGFSGTSLANEGRSNLHDSDVARVDITPPDHILDVCYAFWKAKALLSAVELDVFTHLANGPLNIEALTTRIGLHTRGARDFLDALVALKLLLRDADGSYSNQPDTDFYLDRGKQTYIGGLLQHLNARHYQNWSLLTRALQTGEPQSGALATGSYPALYADNTAQKMFLNGMTAGSLLAAQALAVKIPWKDFRTVIDIGTAQGCVPVEIARTHVHLTGGGFDLPQVEPAFRSYVNEHGLSERLRFYPGDFFVERLPAADVLVMGRILHNWDLPTKKLLLKKAWHALPYGGVLIVYDPLIDDDRLQPHGLLSSLNMLIETIGGFEYTGAECTEWMQEAGFHETRIEPLGDVHSAVIGIKNNA